MEITREAEAKFQKAVKDAVKSVKNEAASRAIRASNQLRNAALNVLRGQRSGKVYRKPYSKSTYTASAPGEPPAVRTGALRMNWSIRATGSATGEIIAGINSDVPYAQPLDDGTSKIKPRPFKEPIIEAAEPAVKAIFEAPYLSK